MTHIIKQFLRNRTEKGQSLVEVALFLPIFLIIIAGLVEVSNLVITQNSVHNAARVGARFGANGGQNEGIAIAALTSVTDVLVIEDTVWDVWSVRGSVNSAGTDFDDWEFEHVYGLQQTEIYSDVDEAEIRAEVLAQLQTDEFGNSPAGIAGDLDFVGTYLVYDLESILGLNALADLAGYNSLRSLNVMRDVGTEEIVTDACSAFPIAVDEGIRSVLAPDDPNEDAANRWRFDFDYPNPGPSYFTFVNHQPNIPFLEAQEGYLYNIQNGASSGGKGWLAWNQCAASSAGALNDSLSWPGNSMDYTPMSGQCNINGELLPRFPGFMEAGDNDDRAMHIHDWIPVSTGSINASGATGTIQEHIDLNRALRVIVYNPDYDFGASGVGDAYYLTRFAIMRLKGYSFNQGGGESFILAEFVRWDDSCGQLTE